MSIKKISALRQHPLILPVYLPTFLISLAGGIMIPVLPLYLREFEVGYGLVGLVLSGQALGMLIGDIPSGMAMRWMGQRLRRESAPGTWYSRRQKAIDGPRQGSSLALES